MDKAHGGGGGGLWQNPNAACDPRLSRASSSILFSPFSFQNIRC